MLAGFFLKRISAKGAKIALLFGVTFYIITTFIIQVDLHFIHVWGIEIVISMLIMFGVSYYYPRKDSVNDENSGKVDMRQWKYTYFMSAILVLITISIYILLGHT